jgi:hypothetical protein
MTINNFQHHIQTAIYLVIGTMYLSRVKTINDPENNNANEIKKSNKFFYSLGFLYITMGILRLFFSNK